METFPINRLPTDLNRYIYKFVNYDIKVELAMYSNTYLTKKNELMSIFNTTQLHNIYKHCIVENISYKEKGVHRRIINKEILNKLPTSTTYNFVDKYGVEQEYSINHPILMTLEDIKSNSTFRKSNSGGPLLQAIKYFMTMKTHITDLDYMFQKIAYNTINALKYYKQKIEMKNKKLAEISKEKKIVRQEIQNQLHADKTIQKERLNKIKIQEKERKNKEKVIHKEILNEMKLQEKQRKFEEKSQKQKNKDSQRKIKVISKLDKFFGKKLKESIEKKKRFNTIKEKINMKLISNMKRHIIIPYTIQITRV